MKRPPARRPEVQEEKPARTARRVAPDGSPKALIFGGGGAALVLILVLVASSGSKGGTGSRDADRDLSRAINEAAGLQASGNYTAALGVCERALKEPRFRNRERLGECRALAAHLKGMLSADTVGAAKTADLQRRIADAKRDGTAMKEARSFWTECQALIAEYRMTSSGPALAAMREDLQRWVNTESQSDWQRDYNSVRDRVRKQLLANGEFAESAREWKRFGEASQDPVLKNRIEAELAVIDVQANEAALKIVESAGAGPGARRTLEEALPRFTGTGGQAVIQKGLRAIP